MSIKDYARVVTRRLASPIWKRVRYRIESRIDPLARRLELLDAEIAARVSEQRQVIDTLAARLAAFDETWRQHVPALLNATTRAAAAADLTASLQLRLEALEEQQQQLRAEQAALVRGVISDRVPADGAVMLHDVSSALGNFDLHLLFLGPDVAPRPGYVTIATKPGPGIDILSSGTGLPFAAGLVAEITADRFLETLDPGHWRRSVLPHWRSLLRPGGKLHLRLLNPEALLHEISVGARRPSALRESMAGSDALLLHWPDALQIGLEANGFRLNQPEPATESVGGVPMTDIVAIRT